MLMEYSRSVPPPRRRYDGGIASSPPPPPPGRGNTASPRERLQEINRKQHPQQDMNKLKRNKNKNNGSSSYDDTDDTSGRDGDDYYDDDDDYDPNDPSKIIPLLALQVYHLPGNSYWQDWWQFLANNHPIFGICCRHKLHPIKTKTRLVALVGTVVFGLIITNLFYFLYLWQDNLDQTVATIVIPGSSGDDSGSEIESSQLESDTATSTNDNESGNSFTLTTGMLLLWTVGGGIHTTYNLVIWHIAACVCCRPGGCCSNCACCPNLGKRIVRIFVLLVVGFASVLILMRVAINQQQQEWLEQEKDNWLDATEAMIGGGDNSTTVSSEILDDTGTAASTASEAAANAVNEFISSRGVGSASSVKDGSSLVQDDVQQLDFVWSYMIEMILAFFIYYPIGATVLFSGVLGCGSLPLLGGRPREVMIEQKQLQERAEQRRIEHMRRQKEIQLRRQQEELQRRRHALRAQQMRNEIMQLRSIPKQQRRNGGSNNNNHRNYAYDDNDIISPTGTATSNTTATSATSLDNHIVSLGPSFDDNDDIELAWCPRTEQEFYQRRQQGRRLSH